MKTGSYEEEQTRNIIVDVIKALSPIPGQVKVGFGPNPGQYV